MARMAGVPFKGVADNGVMKQWDIVCVHTIVGYAANIKAAHFTTDANGGIIQWRDTAYRSAANLNGNYRVVAIENEDHGPSYGSWNTNDGHAVPGFTSAQKEAIAKILVWAHETHNIPLELVPDSKPGRRGIAYHRQGCDSPNNYAGYAYKGRVPGGELWTSSSGKVCPGDRRITQLIQEIIPRARVLAGVDKPETPETPEEDDFLSALDPKTQKDVAYRVLRIPQHFADLNSRLDGTESKVDRIEDTLGVLKDLDDDHTAKINDARERIIRIEGTLFDIKQLLLSLTDQGEEPPA